MDGKQFPIGDYASISRSSDVQNQARPSQNPKSYAGQISLQKPDEFTSQTSSPTTKKSWLDALADHTVLLTVFAGASAIALACVTRKGGEVARSSEPLEKVVQKEAEKAGSHSGGGYGGGSVAAVGNPGSIPAVSNPLQLMPGRQDLKFMLRHSISDQDGNVVLHVQLKPGEKKFDWVVSTYDHSPVTVQKPGRTILDDDGEIMGKEYRYAKNREDVQGLFVKPEDSGVRTDGLRGTEVYLGGDKSFYDDGYRWGVSLGRDRQGFLHSPIVKNGLIDLPDGRYIIAVRANGEIVIGQEVRGVDESLLKVHAEVKRLEEELQRLRSSGIPENSDEMVRARSGLDVQRRILSDHTIDSREQILRRISEVDQELAQLKATDGKFVSKESKIKRHERRLLEEKLDASKEILQVSNHSMLAARGKVLEGERDRDFMVHFAGEIQLNRGEIERVNDQSGQFFGPNARFRDGREVSLVDATGEIQPVLSDDSTRRAMMLARAESHIKRVVNGAGSDLKAVGVDFALASARHPDESYANAARAFVDSPELFTLPASQVHAFQQLLNGPNGARAAEELNSLAYHPSYMQRFIEGMTQRTPAEQRQIFELVSSLQASGAMKNFQAARLAAALAEEPRAAELFGITIPGHRFQNGLPGLSSLSVNARQKLVNAYLNHRNAFPNQELDNVLWTLTQKTYLMQMLQAYRSPTSFLETVLQNQVKAEAYTAAMARISRGEITSQAGYAPDEIRMAQALKHLSDYTRTVEGNGGQRQLHPRMERFIAQHIGRVDVANLQETAQANFTDKWTDAQTVVESMINNPGSFNSPIFARLGFNVSS